MGWIACLFLILGFWFLGKKNISGWYFNTAGSILWVVYGVVTHQWALVLANTIIAILNIRGIRKWRK